MAFPATYNFNYYRGDTNQIIVRPKSANGESFALAGYTAEYTIADVRGSTGTQYTANATVDTINDLITCTISDSVGRNLAPATYVYDIQIDNGLQVYTILTGLITVTDDVTGAV